MITNLGDFAVDATVYVPFHTFDSNDPSASVTLTGLAVTDIEIYKDGSVTQRSSDAGYALLDTDGIDFDGITGLHGFSIDLSNNTDAGFFAAGSQYWVAVSSITVDGATINFWAGIFTIEKTGGVATILTDTEAALTDTEAVLADTEAATGVIADTEAIILDTETTIADTATIITDTEAILADTEGLAAGSGLTPLASGTAQSGTASTIVLASAATFADNELNGNIIKITAGTGAGQSRLILSNTSADDTCNVSPNWTTNPSSDSVYEIVEGAANLVAVSLTAQTAGDIIADTEAVLSDTEAATAVLTDTEALIAGVNVTQISGDGTAADNLEAMYDGTGYTDDTAPASRLQVSGISSGTGGSVNNAMSSYLLTTGTESANTETATRVVNGTKHEHTDTAGAMDLYYEFDIGGDSTPSEVIVTGLLNGVNDDLEVHAYDWGNTTFEQIGEMGGQSSTTANAEFRYNLLADHVGTGANKGKVRIRFTDGAFTLTTATLRIDQIIVASTLTGRSVGYALGAIWIDTTASNTNTEDYVDGVADNPVSTLAAALTLASSLGLHRFVVAAGSAITLTAAATNYEITGSNYTLAFGGQSIAGAKISGATISGTFTGATAILEYCIVNAITGPGLTMRHCYFNEVTVTNNGTDGWYINDCRSRVAGTGRATFDFGVGVGNTGLSMRNWSGGIELANMGDTGTDNASIEGFGNIVLNVNCDGGTLVRRGVFDFTDNSGNVTIVEDEITEEVGLILTDTEAVLTDTEAVIIDTEAVLADTEAAVPVLTDTEAILLDSEAALTDTEAVLTDTEAAVPVLTDTEAILADTEAATGVLTDTEAILTDAEATIADTEALNTGIITGTAQTGTLSTTQASTDLTGYADDQLIGRVIIWTSGACEGEATDITDYASASGLLTFTALTTAPGNGDAFKVV